MTIYKSSIWFVAAGACDVRCYLIVGAAFVAAACSSPPEPPTHQTVEFYLTNKEARQAKLAECDNDPGALGKTPDCINAKQAARRDMKTLRDLPPLNLPGAKPNVPPSVENEQRSGAGDERRDSK
jgi:hypothetical protein